MVLSSADAAAAALALPALLLLLLSHQPASKARNQQPDIFFETHSKRRMFVLFPGALPLASAGVGGFFHLFKGCWLLLDGCRLAAAAATAVA